MHRDDRGSPAPPSADDGRSRRAGWLAVAATCVALTSVMIAATRIAGPDGSTELLDGFPGPPTGGLLTARPPAPPSPSPGVLAPTTAEAAVPGSMTVQIAPARHGGRNGVEPDGGGTEVAPGRPQRTGAATAPPATTRPTATAEPTVSVAPTVNPPSAAASELIRATEHFYSLLPHDVEGAWALVGGSVRAKGFAAFQAMWAGATTVTLTGMTVVPDTYTVHVVAHVVHLDGSAVHRKYDLVFRVAGTLVLDELTTPTENANEPAR